MEKVSGVTGAAPILHDVFEHLHERFGTSWYEQPTEVVVKRVHPVTGKLFVEEERRNWKMKNEKWKMKIAPPVTEKFLMGVLPPTESPEDYDEHGRVRLPAEYREWFTSRDNWLAGQAVLNESTPTLRIVSPLPGTVFYLDPDLPDNGRRLRLRAEGLGELRWQSDSLECRSERGEQVALLSEGRHQLVVQEPRSGARMETWIVVKAL